MKRIVFCFDGTWNRLSADTPTNVVLTAASIVRKAPDATQIIHYDEGVGTGPFEKLPGGAAGAGLVEIVRRAYGFLIFNYDPGDHILVFGFSRGAFSARTFVGFVRHVGPLHRLHAARIDEALDLYRQRLTVADGASERMRRFRSDYSSNVCIGTEDDAWRCQNVSGYVSGDAPLLTVTYLGLWDTVGALGWPSIMPFSARLNRKYAFHDVSLTKFIERARHAVAIDERRALFPCVPWGDLTDLNSAKGFAPEDAHAPYQEKWFPGTHGSVGGGGDVRGLSDGALAWVVKGAEDAGLFYDREKGSRIHGFNPEPLTSLVNESKPRFSFTQLILTDRNGPDYEWQVSLPAVRRWHALAEQLPEKQAYRPKTLQKVAAALDAYPVDKLLPTDVPLLFEHIVQAGDTLTKLAMQFYGHERFWHAIFQANRDVIDDPDDLFEGKTLRIPRIPLKLPPKSRL